MTRDRLTEILAAHSEGREPSAAPDRTVNHAEPDRQTELNSLLETAALARQVLVPVSPAPAFRARLHDGLVLAAHHQEAQRMLQRPRSEPPWGWLIGAAALGSAAGLVAIALRSRGQPAKSGVGPQPQQ
ncbi:MAG: hypothetical protein M1482_15660 [Chloroflexi bacterium]|nr:hypothetical protein [Chloroflexota bacterium]